RGEPFVAGAQHVGRADIAGADGADIRGAGEPRQDQPERDRAAEIAETQRRGVGRQQRRIEPWRHERFPAPWRHSLRSFPRKWNPGPNPGDERSLCAVCHLSSDTTRKRIRLTRVTRIFQLSVFTKFALVSCYRRLSASGGAKTSASPSCGRGLGPDVGMVVPHYLWPFPCY